MVSLKHNRSILLSLSVGARRKAPLFDAPLSLADFDSRLVSTGTNTPKQEFLVFDPYENGWDEIDDIAPSDEQLMRYVDQVRPPLDYYKE